MLRLGGVWDKIHDLLVERHGRLRNDVHRTSNKSGKTFQGWKQRGGDKGGAKNYKKITLLSENLTALKVTNISEEHNRQTTLDGKHLTENI